VGKTTNISASRSINTLIKLRFVKTLKDRKGRDIFKIAGRGKTLLAIIDEYGMDRKSRISLRDILVFKRVKARGSCPAPHIAFLSGQGRRFMSRYGDKVEIVLEEKEMANMHVVDLITGR
jgi:hypothetical protein